MFFNSRTNIPMLGHLTESEQAQLMLKHNSFQHTNLEQKHFSKGSRAVSAIDLDLCLELQHFTAPPTHTFSLLRFQLF